MRRNRILIMTLLFLAISLLSPIVISAQTSTAQSRITQAVDENNLLLLKGNTHPLARPEFDRGAAPLDLPLERILLVLKRSPEQETALLNLLDQQQDRSSPNYHKWLTPEQFGQQFGPSEQDIQTVTSWLTSHGFQVARVAKGRTVIEFSGTAAQVLQALHTEIHKFLVNGKEHWTNASDLQIPAALASVVAGPATLHNFYRNPAIQFSGELVTAAYQAGARPQITLSSGAHAIVAGDYATIYNINPLYTATPTPINGTGTTIAVIGRTNINVQDVNDFRSAFGLVANPPQVVIDGVDPGDLGGGEEAEAILDTTWSGAIAPNATVKLVVSASTNTTDGVDLSELFIIENNLADVMTESFSTCEGNGNTNANDAAAVSGFAEQAAAQGITFSVASDDAGSAGCDIPGAQQVATHPVSVNLLSSTPFNVAVGGTQFNEHGQDATFWSTTNGPGRASAISYIHEDVWNESCLAGSCPAGVSPNIAAGGGGVSIFFNKPSWQAGVPGIPAGTKRNVPDVSLASSGAHDQLVICLKASCSPNNPINPPGTIHFFLIGGTSAAAPPFAGIMSLVNNKMNVLNQSTHSRQGQANYVLYKLAAAEVGSPGLSTCNASSATTLPANNCVFNDVTVGNNDVPGETGFGTANPLYPSGVGYDLASGLGSFNVANLVNSWSTITTAFTPTSTTLGLNPTTNITHGANVNVNITVARTTGSGASPTGDVSLIANTGPNGQTSVDGFTLGANGSLAPATTTGQFPGGTYNVTAHYTGDGTFGTSDAAPVNVTVNPEASTTTMAAITQGPNGQTLPFNGGPYGGVPVFLRADVGGVSNKGAATGTVTFSDNNTPIAGGPLPLNSEGSLLTANGVSNFSAGAHSIVGAYSGDASFMSSTSSPAVTFTITQATSTTTVNPSATSVAQGTNITLTATTPSAGAGNPPTGTATFFNGANQIGNPAPLAALPGGGGASASLVTAALPVGQDSITAKYSGDTNYTASTSTAVVVTVGADFTISAGSPTATVSAPGLSANETITIAAQNGFNGTISFTPAACSGLPTLSSCSFNPGSVTGSGSTMLTITTTAPTVANPGNKVAGLGWWVASGGATLGFVFLISAQGRRRRWGIFLGLALFGFLAVASGCGGGGGGVHNPGTPVGMSTVTVTVTSGGVTHSTSFTLNVQ